MLMQFSLGVCAVEPEYNWFFKRNGDQRPQLTDGERLINGYNGVCVDRGCGDEKVIYITFDVGYENGNVERILDTLRAEDVRAAFFVLDNIIYKNIDLVNRMSEEGHLICNHTCKHKNISSYTEEQIKEELGALEALYAERTGKEMSRYFRFPEGRYSESALKHLNNLGYRSVFWSFAYDDWDNGRQPSPERAIKKILDNTHCGEIILLHPTSATNAEIMPTLISKWKEMGYRFGTLDEIFM